ncbi:MAG: sigma-70 family RNA polymerase sigma factor [Acidobacteria bacterium]|nr:sigma-70 family RNA polymerase sigma factor [Acidobacteriota bacterium]
MNHLHTDEANAPSGAVAVLLENHRAFLGYLERRVGDRALAEDILQEAFARNLDRVDRVAEKALIPWFYRTLRNATIDQYRRRSSADRALEAFARELEIHDTPPEDVEAEICRCVTRLATTLKPEYAEVLQAIEVDGIPVKTFAERKGLSASNAGVRAFRAREALRKRLFESCGTCADHGCVDCRCRPGRRVSDNRDGFERDDVDQ